MSKNILVVEDDPDIARLVKLHLNDTGYAVDHCSDGNAALLHYQKKQPDLVILDLMLPGMNGLDLCRQMRKNPSYIPILMLTAKSTELDRVLGLEIGADDYISKPFSIQELVARVNAQFRRVDAVSNDQTLTHQPIRIDELAIDPDKRTVHRHDEALQLTSKEFDLLLEFATHPGRAYSRTQLLDKVWGYGHDGYEHTVNSHINRLRAKIEIDPAKPHYILTVWGIGYKFTDISKHV
jgi:DNA-binding response OmpR family regulator